MTKRTVYTLFAAVLAVPLLIAGVNYVNLQHSMSQVLSDDERNKDISVSAHYEYYLNPAVLVYDLRSVPGTSSPMDITRVMLQFAEKIKDRSFKTVELNHRGNQKFVLKGKFFQKLGEEYKTQNPAYTLRTLPENLYKPDGTAAYGTWTGGILGVLGHQMEDFASFHQAWYIDDLVSETKGAGHAG
jgi:hypothetical protein